MGTQVKKKAPPPPESLTLRLGDPGMTPLLRAGLGGLAASLRAITLADGGTWSPHEKQNIRLGPGHAEVDEHSITLHWGSRSPEETLQFLFERSFCISPERLIDLPGARDSGATRVDLLSALQGGLKRTFLQHGKTTKKAGATVPMTIDIDDRKVTFQLQPYETFVHREKGPESILAALKTGAVDLAGWAYPGAAQRHTAFGDTRYQYGPGEALCACFALVGCLSLQVSRMGAGVLVIPEPNHLLRFAITRPRLTPRGLPEAFVSGTGDAVLIVHVALKIDHIARGSRGVARVHGILLRTTAWDSKQKYRVATISTSQFSDHILDLYHEIMTELPTRIILRTEADQDDEESGFFATTSALRGFVADNIAQGRRWFTGFATATAPEKKPRFIHYYRDKDNLGALWNNEKKGLIAMTKYLDEAETILVRSVHVALRQRFGAIADETDNPQTRKNRWNSEREKWRLAFAGSKTHEQVRAALADLWSRAGANRELRAGWEKILPLLRAEHWQSARDLALVALASYQGTGSEESDAELSPEQANSTTSHDT